MSEEPVSSGGDGRQRELRARFQAVVEAKDAELVVKDTTIAMLQAELSTEREFRRQLELRVAELERRQNRDSTNSGTPTSKESIEAAGRRKKERRERRERQASERDRDATRKPGGQPGHAGARLPRDPEPNDRKEVEPPHQCAACGKAVAGAKIADPGWAQIVDVLISRLVTEYLLPARECECGHVTVADAPGGAKVNDVVYGKTLNAAALLLAAYGNVPSERTAKLIFMLLGMPVSTGFVDKAATRMNTRLNDAGFDAAMQAAFAAEPAAGADETPVNVLYPELDPETGKPEGSPHVLIVATPDGRLRWLRAMASRKAAAITAILDFFTGFLITDGYSAYQQMLGNLAGIQQCVQHVIRRARQVAALGPGSLQSWAADIIELLREAHTIAVTVHARGHPTDDEAEQLAKLRLRFDEQVAFGITHNQHRDWDRSGNHPAYVLGCWLRDHADQVWLFTSEPSVEWTNNVSERGAKAAKRHQAVSGYWHNDASLQRWCRIRSYLDSAMAHGLTALEAISYALTGDPWLPLPRIDATA